MPAMIKSKQDDVMLVYELIVRLADLNELFLRVKGREPVIHATLQDDLKRVDTVALRHKKGDFRHTDMEIKSVKTIAQWALDLKKELCEQPPEVLAWKD